MEFYYSDKQEYQILENVIEDYPSFHDWFLETDGQFPLNKTKMDFLTQVRLKYNGMLFYDRLLELFGIHGQYPPKNLTQLESLFDSILDCSESDLLRRHCLIYYLIKDVQSQGRENEYADMFLIHSQYRLVMDGLWALDHGVFHVIYSFNFIVSQLKKGSHCLFIRSSCFSRLDRFNSKSIPFFFKKRRMSFVFKFNRM